jgi:hypothetical protein
MQLLDLHDLLQHFEENHVCVESELEEDEDEDLPFEFDGLDDMDVGNDSQFDIYLSRQQVCLADICAESPSSAFDTNVIRKRPLKVRKISNHEEEPQTLPLAMDGPTVICDDSMDIDEMVETPSKLALGEHSLPDRPYKCKVQGCYKAYKNPGGLKYHMQHGHCQDTGDPEMNNIIHKPYQCTVPECQKRYKNLNGLKVIQLTSIILNTHTLHY